jgi:hypothetical protein
MAVQPPFWRPLLVILAGGIHLFIVKWFVPDGVKMAGDGVTVSVERTMDLIAFFIFCSRVLYVFFQDCLVFFIFSGPVCNLYPPLLI